MESENDTKVKIIPFLVYMTIICFILYHVFITERSGLDFAVKMNFIAALVAPVVALSISEYLSIENNIPLIAFLTAVIIFKIGLLTTLKASDDNDCKEYNYTSSIIETGKLVLIEMLMFLAVLMSPILQSPFVQLLNSVDPTLNPESGVYIIVGIYMAFISLSTSVISYMSEKERACYKSREQTVKDYENNNTIPPKKCKP